jgi:uroporphyrinogen-III decarboxylase
MTYRKLFEEIMHYGTFDRMPVVHWAVWSETEERWRQEGLPEGADIHEYLGAEHMWSSVDVDNNLYPTFAEEVFEETDEYRIFRDADGVVKQEWKHKECIPHYIDFTLKTADDWPEYKKRLQPDPARVPDGIEERIKWAEESDRPITTYAGSLMGWIRNWMGIENMSYLMYDSPDCYGEMVDTISDLVCWGFDRVLPLMCRPPHMALGWEDICGRSGPLVSPWIFDRFVAPGYRKIREKLDSYGVRIYGIDSDGDVGPLIQNWLDAGVNLQFPLQPGPWGGSPENARRRFGKELRIFGGFDKMALEAGPAAIDAEIAKHVDVMKEGGFLMMPDHLITPGTPLENYRYYIRAMRELRF